MQALLRRVLHAFRLKTVVNFASLVTERMLRIVVGLFITTWMSQHLGPEKFGILSYAISFIAIFQSIASLGMDQILARELPKANADVATLLGVAAVLRLTSSIVCFGLSLAISYFIVAGDMDLFRVILVFSCVLFFQPADLIDLFFQSQLSSSLSAIARTVALAASSALRVYLIVHDAGLIYFALTYVVEACVALLVFLLFFLQRFNIFDLQWDANLAKKMLRDSWPLLLSGLAIIIYLKIDQLLLKELGGLHELGLYSAILPFVQTPQFLATAICASLGPVLVRAHDDLSSDYDHLMSGLFFSLFWISFSISASVALFAYPLVELLLGPAYAAASAPLAIRAFTLPAVFMGVAQALYLNTIRRSDLILAQTIVGAISAAVLNVLLIPQYGAVGSAVAAVISFMISAVFANAVFHPHLFWLQIRSVADARGAMATFRMAMK